ncbi:MAG: tripartite tricarboxylate transporter substrate binding protein [Bradyrhizobium sp.]
MRLHYVLLVVALTCLSSKAGAENYPDRPIRIVVPTGPGGAADIVSRLIAERMQKSLQQTIIIENKPGANGNIGATYALSAPADGYTLMMGHIGLMTVNAHLYANMTLNPLTDFVPVSRTTTYPNLLVVNNDIPVHSTAELISYAKTNPTGIRYSSSGFGSSFHMGFELLKLRAGIDAVHVPYTGTAHALTAVIAGNVETTFTDVISAAPQIEARALRGLAISSRTRAKNLPDVPTVAESGVPGLQDFDVIGWNGIVVKAGTPTDRIKLLNDHIRQALRVSEVIERISVLGADVADGTPEEFGEFMRAEDAKWGGLVAKAGLKSQQGK